MKTYISNLIASVKAASDINANYFIGLDGAVCGAGAVALGVSIDSAATGEGLPVAMNGLVPVIAGGSISAGDAVKSDANGKAVAASAGDMALGYAMEAASAGDEVMVKLGTVNLNAA